MEPPVDFPSLQVGSRWESSGKCCLIVVEHSQLRVVLQKIPQSAGCAGTFVAVGCIKQYPCVYLSTFGKLTEVGFNHFLE